MDKNVKILGLVLMGLFVIFFISGDITGAFKIPFFGSQKAIEQPFGIGEKATGDTCTCATGRDCSTLKAGTPACVSCCYDPAVEYVSPTDDCISKDKFCSTYCVDENYYSKPSEGSTGSVAGMDDTYIFCQCSEGPKACPMPTTCAACCGTVQ